MQSLIKMQLMLNVITNSCLLNSPMVKYDGYKFK